MPTKDHERDVVEVEERPREKRRGSSRSERKGVDGEKDREHRHRHRSSRSATKSRPTDSDVNSTSTTTHRRHRTTREERPPSPPPPPPMEDTVPELGRSRERVHVPYPSFSKAHSKENVLSRDDLTTPSRRTDPLTPEATDLGGGGGSGGGGGGGGDDMRRSTSAENHSAGGRKSSSSSRRRSTRPDERPPSPPDTNLSGPKEQQRSGTPVSIRSKSREHLSEERPRSRTSYLSRSTSRADDRSKISIKSKTSSQATYVKSPAFKSPFAESAQDDGGDSVVKDDDDGITTDVGSATTGPTKRNVSGETIKPDPIDVDDLSPESLQDSSPKTPTQTQQFPPPPPPPSFMPGGEKPMGGDVQQQQQHYDLPQAAPTPGFGGGAAIPIPPPPPPPPLLNIQEAPRVDYLLQNGGLLQAVPRNFLAVLPRQNGSRPSNPPLQGAQTLFAPFFNLLNQYQQVINNQGSIAVATGHRTIARRLLDRLENVFSRDLSPDGCGCVICERSDEPHRGLGWGEVLERVSGRIEIPSWPPFDLASMSQKAAVETAVEIPQRPASPVKMDPDIAEELRGHYLRQNKKTRASVSQWMNSCAESPAPPPQDVDDETLTFAILTNLDQNDRPFFNALLTGSRELQPATRAPTPMRKPRQDFIVKAGLSLQRLYRLATAPRDAETILFLVKHHHMHDLLHTISDINPSEWEILISGRFDGFLWSGADDDNNNNNLATPTDGGGGGPTSSGFFPPPPPGRLGTMSPAVGMMRSFTPGTRNTTPFSAASGAFSRGATPASFISGTSMTSTAARTAVSHDEEAEVAALAELEREIFLGMEALEDAFETLHQRAEVVREALRLRGAGLSVSLQQRRGGFGASRIDVLPQSGESGVNDRPAWWPGDDASVASESDWGGDDYDIAPEDSASNISSSRTRRPKRRTERRTPAPIEEEEDE